MGVDGEMEGGAMEGCEAVPGTCPPVGSRVQHVGTQGAALAEANPAGPGGSSLVN